MFLNEFRQIDFARFLGTCAHVRSQREAREMFFQDFWGREEKVKKGLTSRREAIKSGLVRVGLELCG